MFADSAEWAARRAGQLAAELLSLARRPASQERVVDLNEVVQEFKGMLAHVWTARRGQGWSSKISGGSKAIMCPASSCGNMAAGPDRFRERYPNRWAVLIYHGPARIFSFVGSTDYYLLLRS